MERIVQLLDEIDDLIALLRHVLARYAAAPDRATACARARHALNAAKAGVVPRAGFEPATFRLGGGRSIP